MSADHTAENGLGVRAEIERVLRENGLTDDPANYDGDMHSWRCSYPDIYGPCDCFAELAADLARIIPPAATERDNS